MKARPFTYLFTSLLIFFLLISCIGQTHTNETPTNPHIQNDAQISEYVVEIFEDSNGNLWFGTMSDGVASFDGNSLTYFTAKDGLSGNTVASITEDREGNLWFGTHSGLSKFDGKSFINFTTKEGLYHDRVSNLLIDRNGMLWVGTWGGICKFDGKAFEEFPVPKPDVELKSYQTTMEWVTEIMEDSHGNIWFAWDGYGACKFDGTTFTHFTKQDGLTSNNVQEIEEDKDGNIWFGSRVAERDHPDTDQRTGDGGLSRFDGKVMTQFPDTKGLSRNEIYSISRDRSGELWIGANGVGVYRYDGTDFQLVSETDRPDLMPYGYGIQSILEDRNGTIWLGLSGGLFRLEEEMIKNVTRGGRWKGYDAKVNTFFPQIHTNLNGMVREFVRCMYQDTKGNFWFGTNGDGIIRYDGVSLEKYRMTNGPGTAVRGIAEDHVGQIWFGTSAGLVRYDGEAFTQYGTDQGLSNEEIWGISTDRDGNVWISTVDGVFKFNGEAFAVFHVPKADVPDAEPMLSDNRYGKILSDRKGNTWFLTDGYGITIFNGRTFRHLTEKDGLPDNNVADILEDRDGNVWIGTFYGGVSRYDGTSFTNFTKDGIIEGIEVYNFCEDKNGNIWFSAENVGVYRYDGKSFDLFTTDDGLATNGVQSIYEDRTGQIWFGTWAGISLYDGEGFQNAADIEEWCR